METKTQGCVEVVIRMIEFNEFLVKIGMLYKDNRPKYNDAWLFMPNEALAAGLLLKAARIGAMIQANSDKRKIADDLMDLAIYCYFLYAKLGFGDDGS